MKVRELCYTGTLRNTPMHLTKGYTRQFIALPTVNDTYSAQRKVRELSEFKLSHLKQMCSNYIQRDEWHELLQDSPYIVFGDFIMSVLFINVDLYCTCLLNKIIYLSIMYLHKTQI